MKDYTLELELVDLADYIYQTVPIVLVDLADNIYQTVPGAESTTLPKVHSGTSNNIHVEFIFDKEHSLKNTALSYLIQEAQKGQFRVRQFYKNDGLTEQPTNTYIYEIGTINPRSNYRDLRDLFIKAKVRYKLASLV